MVTFDQHNTYTMLATQDLSYAYNGDASKALRFPDFRCKTGEHWLLIGQSGSGKTTLLHLLAGLRTPLTGKIKINDSVLNELPSRKAMDQFRGRNIGVIFQQSHFVRSLNVQENLILAQTLAGLKPDLTAIEAVLNDLNLSHKIKARTSELSVGEQQRVNIARAVVNKPTVILADEPTSALDDVNTEKVVKLLKMEAEAAKATLLIVTHDNRLKSVFDKKIEL